MAGENRYSTKRKMFVSYIGIPILILTVFSCVFLYGYFRMSGNRILTFENTIAENVNNQFKNVMDNLLKSASQYSMTPWVKRLKYLQKIPEKMSQSITASNISDYASMLSLTEINDSLVESIYIYYSLGEFGISSSGKIGWQEYINIYKMQSDNQELMGGELLSRNNQRTICTDVSFTKDAKRMDGFLLIQTIPLENSYSGEVNVLFFVPYSHIYHYIQNFTDDGTDQLCLTDGTKVLYTEQEGYLSEGESIRAFQTGEQGVAYIKEEGVYASEYTKVGMNIGVLQILDNRFLHRDFLAFLKWILVGDLLLTGFIFVVSLKLAKRSYEPLEHIINLLDKEQAGSGDEYQMIEKALQDLESQKKKLEVAVYEQNPLLEQYLLHNLLHAKKLDVTEEKYINTMRQYALFRSLVLRDGAEARQYIVEIDAALAIYPQVHTAFLKEDSWYFWILSYGEDELADEIANLLDQTFQELGCRDAVLGMSAVFDEIRCVPVACRQAMEALGYHFFYPERRLLLFDQNDFEKRNSSNREFTVTQAQRERLLEALSENQLDRVMELYLETLTHNFYDEGLSGKCWFKGVRCFNEQIANAFREQGCRKEQLELPEPENFASMESYLQVFRAKLEKATEAAVLLENPLYAARNERIRQYVEKHLTDENLSLNETARVMHYTSTYFGKYFKEQFGCTFQQYVAVKRIECAKAYLQHGENGKKMGIQEIALKCGFTNDVTFRRTFKRYVGQTPSQFCKEDGEVQS